MRRRIVLASLPFLVISSALLPISFSIQPMIPLVSNDKQDIARSEIVDRYYYYEWPVELSAYQRAEFQFSSSRPVDFYIFNDINWNLYLNDQTPIIVTSSLGEWENTHSFIPSKTDTYHFMLLNTSGQDAAVNVTVRRSFMGMEYVAAALLVFGGVLASIGFLLKPKAVDIPSRVLEVLKMHGRISITELASIFSTSKSDVEMCLVRLRLKGEPIQFEARTDEVSYGPQPRPPEEPSQSVQSEQSAPPPQSTTKS